MTDRDVINAMPGYSKYAKNCKLEIVTYERPNKII